MSQNGNLPHKGVNIKNIPGSSKYAKHLPFGSKKAQILHTWKIQVFETTNQIKSLPNCWLSNLDDKKQLKGRAFMTRPKLGSFMTHPKTVVQEVFHPIGSMGLVYTPT